MANINNSTLLIRLSDNKYPYSLYQVRNEVKFLMPAEPTEELVSELGFAVVDPIEKPVGDVVTEGAPSFDAQTNRYTQVWEVRSFTPEEIATRLDQAKATRTNILNNNLTKTLEQGFEYIFADADVLHVQLRDGDRANLAGLRLTANKLITAGEVNPVMEIMTYEDVSKTITPQEMVDLTDAAFDNYTGIMKSKWMYRAQIQAATTTEEIPIIPEIIPVYTGV